MSKAKGGKLPWDARAADVLAGRTKVDAIELIGLVNEVNPTGRGRDAKENAVRYALKARLQSFLVARFGDVIEAARDPAIEDEGVVSLRHRGHRQAACHAVVDTLDDAARSWVKRALDLGAEPESEPAPARAPAHAGAPGDDEEDPSRPDALLGAAVRAEEAYDFERAERLYGLAFRQVRDARTAHALLRFLVDAMAADEAALALDDELPAAAHAHPGVRVLLGVAAARSGDDARAAGYVAHLEEPRAAEVLALVARSALGRGDAEEAAQRLREAEAADPAYPDLRPIAEELAKLRESQRAPHEAELARLVSEGRVTEAAEKAEAILVRWPESEAARRAVRALEARRQADEGRRLLGEADRERARGEAAAALGLFQRALAMKLADLDRARAQRAVEELVAEEREREVARRVAPVAAALASADKQERARGLAAYAELDEDFWRARARGKGNEGAAALDWIDGMLGAGARPRAAADAALALERAALLPEADHAAVLALLAPHERALEAVPFARRLAGGARERAAADRHRHARDTLRAAEEALDAGDDERARGLLERAGRDLDREGKARAEALHARLAAHGEQHALEKRFERSRGAHHWDDARRAAETLAASADGPARARWAEVARTYRDEVRRELRVRVHEPDGATGAMLSRGSYLFLYPMVVPHSVDLQTGLAWFGAGAGRDVFVRAFSVETGRLVRFVHLVAPAQLDEPHVDLSGESVMVMGGSNGILELSFSGDPLRYIDFRDPNKMERRFTTAAFPVPGGRLAWVLLDDDADQAYVYDLDRGRFVRELGYASFDTLPGTSPPRVALVRDHSEEREVQGLSLHEPGGAQTARFDLPGDIEAVAPHPRADGLFVVTI